MAKIQSRGDVKVRALRLQDIKRNTKADKALAVALGRVRARLMATGGFQTLSRNRVAVLTAMGQVMGVRCRDIDEDPFGYIERFEREGGALYEGQIAPPRMVFPLGEGRGEFRHGKLMQAVLSRLEGVPVQLSMSSRVRLGEGV